MKLIIDIDEQIWEMVVNTGTFGCYRFNTSRAIRNGIPLDKHDEEVIKETVESIWGKPPYTEVLDKIRAEIKALSNANPSYWYSGDMVEREEVFEIIDKYRTESENEE